MTDHLEPRGHRCPTCKAEPGEPCRSRLERRAELGAVEVLPDLGTELHLDLGAEPILVGAP